MPAIMPYSIAGRLVIGSRDRAGRLLPGAPLAGAEGTDATPNEVVRVRRSGGAPAGRASYVGAALRIAGSQMVPAGAGAVDGLQCRGGCQGSSVCELKEDRT